MELAETLGSHEHDRGGEVRGGRPRNAASSLQVYLLTVTLMSGVAFEQARPQRSAKSGSV